MTSRATTATRWAWLGATLALALGGVLSAGDASACDCAPASLVLPSETTARVPSNTKVWVRLGGCIPVLRNEAGEEVPTTLSALAIGGDKVMVLHPRAELSVGASYQIEGCTSTPRTFTVTEGRDTTPPPVPVVELGQSVHESGEESSCGSESYSRLTVAGEGDLFVLDIAGRATLDPDRVQGPVVDLFEGTSWAYVGTAACSANWDFDTAGSAADTRLGAYDLAGNFSGFGAPLDVSDNERCGCSTTGPVAPGRTGVGLLALLPALVLWGRRRGGRQSAQLT